MKTRPDIETPDSRPYLNAWVCGAACAFLAVLAAAHQFSNPDTVNHEGIQRQDAPVAKIASTKNPPGSVSNQAHVGTPPGPSLKPKVVSTEEMERPRW